MREAKITVGNVGEDMRALRIVSPAYAGRDGELTAVLQYVYQAISLGESGMGELSADLYRIAYDEMHHLQVLGTLITKLGAPPVFTACPPYPVSYYSASCVCYVRGAREMIAADIRAEQCAIASYCRILEQLQNPAVSEVISALLEEEQRHLKLLEDWAQRLC